MITMNKSPFVPDFSSLRVKPGCAGMKEAVGVAYSPLGLLIFRLLKNLRTINSSILIRQYKIMPDHLHILLEIKEKLAEPLGHYIAIFKRRVTLAAQQARVLPPEITGVFETGFNDQFLRSNRSLDAFYVYIRENPYRLWVRLTYPEFFRRINSKSLCGYDCSLYGNFQLLNNPAMETVVIHRKDTPEELRKKKLLWKYIIDNAGVIVGAFVADGEKKVFDYASETSGKIILIQNKGLEKREKPHKKLFELCERGQLLIVSPKFGIEPSMKGITRQECLLMNGFAEKLSRLHGG